jgi:hypothetical protein
MSNEFFGDADDAKMAGIKDDPLAFSKVASWKVGGQVIGSVGGTDHFGVVPEGVGAVIVGGTLIPTTPGRGNDDITLGITADFSVREI